MFSMPLLLVILKLFNFSEVTTQSQINAMLRMILQLALLLAMDTELSLMAIVNAIMAILMMELIMLARTAIIAGN